MSTLARDLESPTIHKLTELCEMMEVHPLTLLALAYTENDPAKTDQLLARVSKEPGAIADMAGQTRPDLEETCLSQPGSHGCFPDPKITQNHLKSII